MQKFTKETIWEGNFLRVVGKRFVDKKGNNKLWECVERTNSREIVAIFAVTPEKELVLAKQYRYPLESYVVELPAGLSDKPGESLEKAARRELLEETGYKAGEMIEIQRGSYNSGMSGDTMVIYYAPDVEYEGFEKVESDDTEEIEVIKVPLDKLVDFCLEEHEDFMLDIKILAKLKILEAKKLI